MSGLCFCASPVHPPFKVMAVVERNDTSSVPPLYLRVMGVSEPKFLQLRYCRADASSAVATRQI